MKVRKSESAFKTISEVAEDLGVPQHVLRFWETRFSQVRPIKRAGGRRYYRPEDVLLLRKIRVCLYEDGFTIKGVRKLLEEEKVLSRPAHGGGSVTTAEADSGSKQVSLEGSVAVQGKLNPETRCELEDVLRELEDVRALFKVPELV